MSRLPEAISFSARHELLEGCGFNIIQKILPSVTITGLPIDSRDRFTISSNFDPGNCNVFLTSPLCGLDSIGLACACMAERNHKPLVYGFSHSAGQAVNCATIASVWLAFSAGLLISKIRLKKHKEFLSYGCFCNNDIIDVDFFLENVNANDDIKSHARQRFENKDIVPIGALSELFKRESFKIKPWLYSFAKISEQNWRFPASSLITAASLDCRFLSGGQEVRFESVPRIDYGYWRMNAFDPVMASINAHCVRFQVDNFPIFAFSNGIVGIRNRGEDDVLVELWHETMDLSKSLVSERIKWNSSKSAVRNWYAAKLRKYGNASKK